MQISDFPEQGTHTLGINRGIVGNGQQFMGDRIEGSQDIKTFSPRWSFDEQATHRPEIAQQGRQDKMGGIHKKDGSCAGRGFRQSRLQLFFLKASCVLASPLAGIMPTFRGRIPSERRNWRTCVGDRWIPVHSCILSLASFTLAGGYAWKYASMVAA
jgi:hypothetical protein